MVPGSDSRAIWDSVFRDAKKARKSGGLYFYRLALERIEPGDTICDVGCGYTFYLDDLMGKCSSRGLFLGVDFSSVAVQRSARLAKKHDNAHLLLGDMRELPIASSSFDRVLCGEGLPYLLGDAEQAFAEMARVARHEVVFSVHTRGAYRIKGTPIEFIDNVVVEHKEGAKPPRRVFEEAEVRQMVRRAANLRLELVEPLRWADVCTMPGGAPWASYLPAKETIALYYVVARKTRRPERGCGGALGVVS
jgi:SAM-dependent methyltransferase